jgi:internalin A
LKGNGIASLDAIAQFDDLSWLFLQDNQLTDLSVLVDMAKKDFEGQRRFAPFWKIYLKGNPLGEGAQEQIKQLQAMGARINLTD